MSNPKRLRGINFYPSFPITGTRVRIINVEMREAAVLKSAAALKRWDPDWDCGGKFSPGPGRSNDQQIHNGRRWIRFQYKIEIPRVFLPERETTTTVSYFEMNYRHIER